MASQPQLRGRRKDAQLASRYVIHEHGLTETQLGGDGLSPSVIQPSRVEHDAERVAVITVGVCKHAQDVDFRHA